MKKNLALILMMLTAACVLLTAGCDNAGNSFKRGDQQCVITPQLKKILKNYDVYDVRNDLMVVGARTPMVDETGRSFYPRGCINEKGKVVIPIQYESVGIGDGVFIVSNYTNQGRRYGMLDDQGNELLPIEYEEISWPDIHSSRKHISVKKNGLYGMVDKTGKVVIPIQYEYVGRFYVDKAYRCYSEDELPDIYISYKKNDGKPEVFNLSPEKMERKPSTLYDANLVGKDGNQSFIDYQGRIIAGPFQNVRVCGDLQTPLFPEGLAAVVKNNKIGFIDMQGKVKIPFKFYYNEFDFNIHSEFGVFSEGLAAMMKPGNKWGYIDKNGKEVIPFVYGWAARFHQGSAIVGNLIGGQEKYGLIDKNNSVILPFEFETGVYTGNVFALCQNGKWGVYSPSGVCVTPCEYDQLITFFEGYATVVKNGKKGLINEHGQLLIPCEYETCLYDVCAGADVVYVVKNGKWGCVDLQNQVMVPIEFDEVGACTGFNGNLFVVKREGRYGLYDRCGNCTLD
jgi:hypothetical protein